MKSDDTEKSQNDLGIQKLPPKHCYADVSIEGSKESNELL